MLAGPLFTRWGMGIFNPLGNCSIAKPGKGKATNRCKLRLKRKLNDFFSNFAREATCKQQQLCYEKKRS